MKNIFLGYAKHVGAVMLAAILFASCTYKQLIDYPYIESVYLPAALNGTYAITPNVQAQPFRFRVEKATNKFIVPLGVKRGGVNYSASVSANITVNNDTITKLIAAGKFVVAADPTITTEILPTSVYSLPNTVTVATDSTLANFNLTIDLPFLANSLANFPKKRYALGVAISSTGKAVDSAKSTAIIFIDPTITLPPTASFSTYVDNGYKTVGLNNASLNGASYSWDFGDATPISSDIAPSHKYAASGTYTVTLTATGFTGLVSTKTASVTIP